MQARWFDPVTAQFTSEDPALDGLNWYAYAGDNPLGGIDPSGLISQEIVEIVEETVTITEEIQKLVERLVEVRKLIEHVDEEGNVTTEEVIELETEQELITEQIEKLVTKYIEIRKTIAEATTENKDLDKQIGDLSKKDSIVLDATLELLADKNNIKSDDVDKFKNDVKTGITPNTNENDINWDTVKSGLADIGWGTMQTVLAISSALIGTALAPETIGTGAAAMYGVAYWYGMQAAGSFAMGLSKIALGFQGNELNVDIPAGIDLLTPGVPTSTISCINDTINSFFKGFKDDE
jgi:hypothetical protein